MSDTGPAARRGLRLVRQRHESAGRVSAGGGPVGAARSGPPGTPETSQVSEVSEVSDSPDPGWSDVPAAGSARSGSARSGSARSGSDRSSARTAGPAGPAIALPAGVVAVLHALPGAAIVTLADGAVVFATPEAERLRVVRHGRLQVEELAELIRGVADDGRTREQTVRAGWRGRIRPDGAGRSLSARARALPADGPEGLILLLVEDHTEALRVEAARQDFVVNVSHELKTPVGAISLLAEALQAAKDDPVAVVRFARRVVSESERLATLVGEIVELSRLQLHEPVASAANVRVLDLVGAAFDRSRVDAEAKGIQLVSAVPADLTVTGDRGDLTSALGNLVQNALAYSPSQTRVTVSAARTAGHPGEDDVVEIAVADQGIGIPLDKQDRIFERFFRLDEARTRATGGTGLGLAIVKHIATGHGGTVRVWSVPGAGSTFTLRLPQPRDGHAAEGAR